MRKMTRINDGWTVYPEGKTPADGTTLDLPYTWNGVDGQDGGGDYLRTAFNFERVLDKPDVKPDEDVYLEFKGVNSSADVYIDGDLVTHHDGGYSTFRVCVTERIKQSSTLRVRVDNGKTEKVYPQTADFTFYGGIYRDVNLIVVNKTRFDLDHFGSCGLKITPTVEDGDGKIVAEAYVTGGEATVTVSDADGYVVASGKSGETLTVPDARLWNGVVDPYLYTVRAELTAGGKVVDAIEQRVGFRAFSFDPKKGFFLNGKSYPLRGVSRHQDRPNKGNALSRADHEEDMAIIKEIGANTIRLAHYQHDDYFYDLCDEAGMVVWAEIPYISRHMPDANDNATQQMRELICQQYNHPCIVTWGVSNEITMHGKHRKDMLAYHRKLNDLVHELDKTRPTVMACFAMCGPANKAAHITDIVGWNLYLGWYVPGFFLNDLWLRLYHTMYKKSCLAFSEYGAEGMSNLHSEHPKRGDNSEEYQADYHEYMLECFERHPYLWGTYVWNMFDFAADARNQGGEPGMNHKGLVTFDRKTRKDSFYIYKAYWSKEPVLHIAGKRFINRTGGSTVVKVYSNLDDVTLTANGVKLKGKKKGRVFIYKVKLAKGQTELVATAGGLTDSLTLNRVKKPDPDYKLHVRSETQSWQK